MLVGLLFAPFAVLNDGRMRFPFFRWEGREGKAFWNCFRRMWTLGWDILLQFKKRNKAEGRKENKKEERARKIGKNPVSLPLLGHSIQGLFTAEFFRECPS